MFMAFRMFFDVRTGIHIFIFSFSIYILFYLCNAYGNCADYENVGYVGKEEG